MYNTFTIVINYTIANKFIINKNNYINNKYILQYNKAYIMLA